MQNMKEYKKYKDRRPEDTINKLQNILHDAGLEVTYSWKSNEELECYSNRLCISGTSIGTNGKGTDKIYALASGYAELLERLQNGAVYTGALDPKFLKETGMLVAPDEKFQKAFDLVQSNNAFLDAYYLTSNCKNNFEKLMSIQKWAGNLPVEGTSDDMLLAVPFVSVKERKVVYLPVAIYSKIYNTNGMCAGNTAEEALVQGLAEIFERHVNAALINHPITPPTIPDEYLKQYPTLWERIREIEKDGKYGVLVKDCSLGKGYPVVGTVIFNRKKGTFGFRIASHYSFPIALERTLTEALQGRNLEEFTEINRIEPEAACTYKENLANIFKCGVGAFRKELFFEKPSYEFVPWKEDNYSNKEKLDEMKKLLLNEGYDILVRDVSYMGFPSYHILVPGFSEIYPVDDYKIKETNTIRKISAGLNNLHQATEEDAQRLLRLLLYKQDALFETSLASIMKRPFNTGVPGGEYQRELLLAACYYRLGKLIETGSVIDSVIRKTDTGHDERGLYYRTVKLLLKLKYEETSEASMREILEKTTGSEVAEKVIAEWLEPKQIFEKLYPKFNCWDCSNCQAVTMCDYPNLSGVLKKLKEIYQKNIPDQNALLSTL